MDSSGQLDLINEEILNKHFDEFMIKMKTFSSDLLRLETEMVSMSADKELISDQLDIKIKIEEGKKKLFEKNVGSLMDTLSSTDQRISVKRQLLSTTGSIEKLKSQKTSIVDQRSSYLTGELVGIAQELSSFHDQLLQLNEELIKNELEEKQFIC